LDGLVWPDYADLKILDLELGLISDYHNLFLIGHVDKILLVAAATNDFKVFGSKA
jgi:hypothetical protein